MAMTLADNVRLLKKELHDALESKKLCRFSSEM